jgi:uncharacterized protein YfaS (alpha-2-macroglobulin family)
MHLRAATLLALLIVAAACSSLQPVPVPVANSDRLTIPVVIVNEDDEPASVEVTLYSALTGTEETVQDPFELAPGDSTRIDVEPTFERDGAFHVIVNGYVAVSSEFMCDPADIGQRSADLPRSVRVAVQADGSPATCPYVEVE